MQDSDSGSVSGSGQPHSWRRLEDLILYPREDLGAEIKPWLDLSTCEDKANLAQAMLALANFGGGFVVIGFNEGQGRWTPAKPAPSDLSWYNQDIINGIVKSYAEPPFQCEVHHVKHPHGDDVFPIVVVPGAARIPIRSKRDGPDRKHVRDNTYYTRAPGPESRPIASAKEWDDLIARCVRSARESIVADLRDILLGYNAPPIQQPEEEARKRLTAFKGVAYSRWKSRVDSELANEKPSRYAAGTWSIAYAVVGDFDYPDLPQLRQILGQIVGHETGWPVWWVAQNNEKLKPHPYNGLVECFLRDTSSADAMHSDFWQASPEGMLFELRGYESDCDSRIEPGTILDVLEPIRLVGECLLHAERFVNALAVADASILMHALWEGLSGRVLKFWFGDFGRRIYDLDYYKIEQDSIESEILVPVEKITTNLPELVQNVTQPLYEAFNFYAIPPDILIHELQLLDGRLGRNP
ncbi:MAG: ATP-binding protein [Armatimonadetes bacterium]|nr:ATP-binding protein [Armatimonadota bacterium]